MNPVRRVNGDEVILEQLSVKRIPAVLCIKLLCLAEGYTEGFEIPGKIDKYRPL